MESLRTKIERFLSVGSGDGSGYGSGYGDGYGDGDGSGSGYGDGYGSGSGYGDGYGDGLKRYNDDDVYYIDEVPTIIKSVKGNYARGYIINRDLTIKSCYVARVDNSFAHGETLKDAVRDAENKALEGMPTEVRIDRFVAEFPTLTEQHTGKMFYDWHHILTGSCAMGRNEFCKAHNVQMDAMYSVGYFLSLVADSYGKDIIKQVRERY